MGIPPRVSFFLAYGRDALPPVGFQKNTYYRTRIDFDNTIKSYGEAYVVATKYPET